MNHLTDYERDGVVLIRSFLSADEVTAARAELDRYIRDDLASKPLNARTLGIDAGRIAVAGDSAGGNLAAVVSLMCRDRGGHLPIHQLLIYPVTDASFETESYRVNGEGYFLSKDMMRWFWHHYLETDEDGASPQASPLRAQNLAGLPPATVLIVPDGPTCRIQRSPWTIPKPPRGSTAISTGKPIAARTASGSRRMS